MRERKEHFTRHVCALIVYHIIKDSRQFYSEALMPRDFESLVVGQPKSRHEILWPETHLYDLAKHIFKLQLSALEVADLPSKWKLKEATTTEEEKPDGKRTAQESGGRAQGGPGTWREQSTRFNFNDTGNQAGGYRFGGGGTFDGRITGGMKHDEMPPQIREHLGKALDECIRLCPTFGSSELREFGGLEMWNLPMLKEYSNQQGHNFACNQGLLGLCRFQDGYCKFKRVDPRDLSKEFVPAFVDVVGPALDKCIEALRQGKTASRPPPRNDGKGTGGGYRSYNNGGRGGHSGSRYGPGRF